MPEPPLIHDSLTLLITRLITYDVAVIFRPYKRVIDNLVVEAPTAAAGRV
jgi:hypothetical protein